MVHKSQPRRRSIVRATGPISAADAIGSLTPGCEIFGLTKGQFSLLDVLCAVLDQTGPADVVVSTWTAASAAIDESYKLVQSAKIRSLRWLVDYSFLARQPKYCELLQRHFGPETIRVTRNHAKFIMVKNDEWTLAIRTSMNLNHNPRLESFEISDDPALYSFLESVVADIFETHQPNLDRTAIGEHKQAFLGFDAQDAGRAASAYLGAAPEDMAK